MTFAKYGFAFLALVVCGSARAADMPWQIYTDAVHGFSISYPPGWKADPAFADRGYRFTQGDPDDVRIGLGLSPAHDIAPGTNLESDQLVLAVQFARPGDLCRPASFLADASPDYYTQVVEDTPDTRHTRAQPGDLYDVEHIVHMVSRSPCIAVQIYLVTARIGAGDAKAPRAVDRAALFRLLSAIIATLRPAK